MTRALLFLAIIVTLATLSVWAVTDFHAYTKYQVVEKVAQEADPDDPFAGTGLYDEDEPAMQTVQRDEFHLGLLPTPQGIFDRHILSVPTMILPFWLLYGVAFVVARRNVKQGATGA